MDCPNVSTKAEHWQRILDEQRLSNLSVVAFCAQKSISVPSFYQWRKKLQPPQASPTKQPLVPVRVIPVAPPVTEQFIQIMTPSGFSIRCNTAVDTQKLTQIIDAIEVTQRGESC
jgi:transposase